MSKTNARKTALYENGSRIAQTELGNLCTLFREIGFRVVRIKREGTLRVYPQKTDPYPLLNPRFKRKCTNIVDCLEIRVLSKIPKLVQPINSRIQLHTDTKTRIYCPIGLMEREYHVHGMFVIKLSFNDDMIDYDALEEDIQSIYKLLK